MSNNNQIKSGETLSFYQLIQRYKIVIPIIQRDYAQGRVREKEVRHNFINALYKYLDENKPFRDLDFIYGNIRNDNEFIPLDGQQRLTTLFLLHWYLYQLSNDTNLKNNFRDSIIQDNKQDNKQDKKSKFLYETRISSTDFCNELVKYNIEWNNLIDNSISKTIKNCNWYFLSWNYDPTIQGMLVMLDEIHNKFKDKEEFFKRLLNEDNPIITFKFLNLQEYHLSDDLYIKMNSRGKQLTNFENFKAQFEKYIKNLNIQDRRNLNNIKVNLQEYFSYKIDTEWADFFWKYRNQSNNTFDEEIMNFIRVILTNHYIKSENSPSKDTIDYLLGTETVKNKPDYSDTISFYKYQELNVFPENPDGTIKNRVKYLIKVLDIIANDKNNFDHLDEKYKFYYNEEEEFKKVLGFNFDSYHKRVMFYAYISYLLEYKKNLDKEKFNQWMRVIHNLSHTDNTRIDAYDEYVNAIKSINTILKNLKKKDNDILNYFTENKKVSLFSSWQIKEEIIKAHLIRKDDNWKKEIEKIEKHKYFNGQIGFILEFSGIWEYYNQNNNCNWDDNKNQEYFKNFQKYSKIAGFIFEESYENRKNDKDYIFERAVLTKGDYLTDASENKKNLLSTSVVKNQVKRDHSWKRLLRVDDDKEKQKRLLRVVDYDKEKQKRNYVKQVFDEILQKYNNIDSLKIEDILNSLNEIIKTRENKFENWRDFFINCKDLFSYCGQGFIRYENDNDILLFKESRSCHLHVEMYSYYLFKNFFENKMNCVYKEVKSIKDRAEINIDNTHYTITIYFKDGSYIVSLKLKNQNDDLINYLKGNYFIQKNDQDKTLEREFKKDDLKTKVDYESMVNDINNIIKVCNEKLNN